MRLAIVTTHPVQYNAPWFRKLSEHADVELRVFYTWHVGQAPVHDAGFGKAITWDIPLIDGYQFELVAPSIPVERRTFWNMDSPQLIQRLTEYQPDAILVFGWNYRSHFQVMRHFHGRVPVLFRGDSTLLDWQSKLRSTLRSGMLRFVYRFIDFALSVGTNNSAYFRHYGLKASQIITVPHAIDNDRFSAANSNIEYLASVRRSELGYSNADTVILFIGKFEKKKCPDRLLAAFMRTVVKRPDLHLLFVGCGPLEESLKNAAFQQPTIQFLPFQNQTQIPLMYRVGDITVLPSSHNETWGLCLNESMASGRPVLASDRVGATCDLVSTGKTGFICEPNEESMYDSLVALPSRSQLAEMGTNGRQLISNWSFEVIVDRIVRLCSSLPEKQKAGGVT